MIITTIIIYGWKISLPYSVYGLARPGPSCCVASQAGTVAANSTGKQREGCHTVPMLSLPLVPIFRGWCPCSWGCSSDKDNSAKSSRDTTQSCCGRQAQASGVLWSVACCFLRVAKTLKGHVKRVYLVIGSQVKGNVLERISGNRINGIALTFWCLNLE